MRILFDNGTPNPISRKLLLETEAAGYDPLLSTGRNIRYRLNLTGRRIATVVLSNQQWPDVRPRLRLNGIVAALNASVPGSYIEVEIPHAA